MWPGGYQYPEQSSDATSHETTRVLGEPRLRGDSKKFTNNAGKSADFPGSDMDCGPVVEPKQRAQPQQGLFGLGLVDHVSGDPRARLPHGERRIVHRARLRGDTQPGENAPRERDACETERGEGAGAEETHPHSTSRDWRFLQCSAIAMMAASVSLRHPMT